MQLDFVGGVVTGAMAVGFLLLLIGVYPSKLRENSLNLVKHGLFSTAATALSLVSIFVIMIPVFLKIIGVTGFASFYQFPIMWLHAVLGALAMVSAVVMILIWVKSPIGELGCAKTWRLMRPTIALWAATAALGIVIYVYGLT